MKSQTLQYYMHDGPSAFRFELAGHLDNEGARQLDQAWRTASSLIGDRVLLVDITFVTSAEEDGRSLLARWHSEGAQLIAKSKVSRELAEAIVGAPLPELVASGDADAGWTWRPFHKSFAALQIVLIAALLFPMPAHAANLKAESVAAWDEYVQSVSSAMQDRARPGGSFLWTYENPERIAKVLSGEIVVAPAPGPNPRRVPGGLIHHWVAAVCLPNAKLDDVLAVTQDYDRYQEFYRPSVIASKTVARRASDDYFSMLLMNKTLFQKTALAAEYQATKVRLDERRFYSVSRTTRVQEIEDYGQPGEHRLPEGEGSGYIWKLFSIVRIEERPEGLYFELEAIALSREIPGAVRLVVEPIVRRVSRNSLLISLEQTAEAVGRRRVDAAKSDGLPARAEQLRDAPPSLSNVGSAFTGVH